MLKQQRLEFSGAVQDGDGGRLRGVEKARFEGCRRAGGAHCTEESDISFGDGRVWIVTDQGVFRSDHGKYVPFGPPAAYLPHQPMVNVDADFSCVG